LHSADVVREHYQPEEEDMNAILRRKKIWEYQNERYLLRLVETSADVSVESVKKAGLITCFLLYIAYKILEGVLAIAATMFKGPRLIRYTGPEAFENIENRYAERPISPFRL
jgi:hypothetical protein